LSLKIDIQLKVICLNGLTPYRKVSNTMSKILTISSSVSANDIYPLNRSVLQRTTYPVPSTIEYHQLKSTPVITVVPISSPFAPDLIHNHSSLFPSKQNDNKPTHIAKSNTEHYHASAYFWQNLVNANKVKVRTLR